MYVIYSQLFEVTPSYALLYLFLRDQFAMLRSISKTLHIWHLHENNHLQRQAPPQLQSRENKVITRAMCGKTTEGHQTSRRKSQQCGVD